ncbi:MAG: crossover junction endodeoxyribonuclease RuvC [Bacteroidetes bacterium]|jgi:crossover junction endodeoxyribonuclease RuvC|nr:crossover junction endodeoxyribonuclease RuvC [Bacteroidota bacterium]
MLVLGIDPGSRHTGYGLIEVADDGEAVEEYGVMHLDDLDTHELRLKAIYDRVLDLIERCKPDECAIEMPVYGRNPQSMLKLGRAQAAAMLPLLNRGLPVTQYTPKEVKKAVTGNGNATKKQVWYMVRSILTITPDDPELGLDASDALAVALCHAHRHTGADDAGSHYSDWSSFARSNPDRIS